MSFDKHITPLLYLSKRGKIRLYISECVIYERARQYYEAEISRGGMIILSAPLPQIVTWFVQLFKEHGAIVISTSHEHVLKTEELLGDEKYYFNADNPNDHRDALIFYQAEIQLTPEENTLILCEEKNLSRAFELNGFKVRGDSQEFVKEIIEGVSAPFITRPDINKFNAYQVSTALTQPFRDLLKKADKDYFLIYEKELPAITDKLAAKLENMGAVDSEIRVKVLGYIEWFSPVSKKDLNELLLNQYQNELIERNAERLESEGLVIDTGSHWLPNTIDKEANEICIQAKASVMSEIVELLGS